MLALILCLLADPEPATPVKVLARGEWARPEWNAVKGGKGLVIRSDDDLLAATPHGTRGAGPDLTIPDARREMLEKLVSAELKAGKGAFTGLDWKKHTAIAILAGPKPHTGFRAEITSVAEEKGVLRVKWKLHELKGPAGRTESHPSACVLIPRHDGKVIFDPPFPK